MISQHGKELKIIYGFKIRFHKMLNVDVKRWCCVNKTCTAYMKTDMSEKTIIGQISLQKVVGVIWNRHGGEKNRILA